MTTYTQPPTMHTDRMLYDVTGSIDHGITESPCKTCHRWSKEFPDCHDTDGCILKVEKEPICSSQPNHIPLGRPKIPYTPKVCPICGKTFHKSSDKNRKAWLKQITCGRKCGSKLREKRLKKIGVPVTKDCPICGKTFSKKPRNNWRDWEKRLGCCRSHTIQARKKLMEGKSEQKA